MLATHSSVEHGAVRIHQPPILRLHEPTSLEEFLLETRDRLGRGLLQPYSFPTREGDLNSPEILRIQILSTALPVLAYALEADLS